MTKTQPDKSYDRSLWRHISNVSIIRNMDTTNKTQEFSIWITQRYLIWQLENGRASIRQYSKWLKVNHSLVVQWMNNKAKPGLKTLPCLAARYGYGVYDVLGLPRPETENNELYEILSEVKSLMEENDLTIGAGFAGIYARICDVMDRTKRGTG